jgi:hypothetical protein
MVEALPAVKSFSIISEFRDEFNGLPVYCLTLHRTFEGGDSYWEAGTHNCKEYCISTYSNRIFSIEGYHGPAGSRWHAEALEILKDACIKVLGPMITDHIEEDRVKREEDNKKQKPIKILVKEKPKPKSMWKEKPKEIRTVTKPIKIPAKNVWKN